MRSNTATIVLRSRPGAEVRAVRRVRRLVVVVLVLTAIGALLNGWRGDWIALSTSLVAFLASSIAWRAVERWETWRGVAEAARSLPPKLSLN